MSHEIGVSFSREGNVVELDMESGGLGVWRMDQDAIPADERNGTAKKLLASSALYCFCAALDTALKARNAAYDKLTGRALLETAPDESGWVRVSKIVLDVTLWMKEEDSFIFERVEKIMKQGCLVTGSLEKAFPVEHKLHLEYSDD